MKNALPRLFAFLALSLAPISTLNAALMVDWGGDYVSGNRSYSNPSAGGVAGPNSADKLGGFSSGAPVLLSPATAYDGTSDTFYGEIIRTSGTSTFTTSNGGNAASWIQQNNTSDRIEIKLASSAVSALFLWKQTDFLNGLNTGSLNLGAGSTVSTAVDTYAAGVPGRAVVKSAGNYYISSAIFSATGTSSSDLTTLSWFSYTPATSISSIGASYDLVSNGVISNVTEIGFFTGITAVVANAVRISSVEFNYVAGAVIPEPSTYATLAGLLLLGVCSLRRRHA